jgi:flavin reductase (DIM6/NTAB) family NADH-FMN oxidoreductase RutF
MLRKFDVIFFLGRKAIMKNLDIRKAFTYIEEGPVILIGVNDGKKNSIMTISWTMVLDFSGRFAICTGAWNESFKTLMKTKECTINIPSVSLLEKVVKIGDCDGSKVDKFKEFDLTPLKGEKTSAPLVKECLASFECRVEKYISKESILILQAVAAYENEDLQDRREIHAIGDGTFVIDGEKKDLRSLMKDKIPKGL